MHLIIATVGTRGDAQPYVALGKQLRERGHAVTVATHGDHRELVESNGLGFRAVCGSFRELLESPAGLRWLESSDSPRAYLRAARDLFSSVAQAWLDEFDAALDDADGVLVHSFALGAIVALERRAVPRVVLSPFPALPSRYLEFSGVPRVPWLGGAVERFAYRFFIDQMWKMTEQPQRRFRAQHGLAPSRGTLWRRLPADGIGHLHLFSEHVVSPPRDWPACAELTGYSFLDAPSDWTPPDRLADFLAAGPPPVYVGFGSMTGMDPAALAAITREALHAAGVRAVIGMGWGGLAGIEGDDDLLVADDVPHDWLFPRMAAIVHHGGAGTTAAVLRAGKPSVVTPFFADQPFWARRLDRLGVTAKPVPKRKLTARRLGAALRECMSSPEIGRRAEQLGAKIRAENGAARAADRALDYLARN